MKFALQWTGHDFLLITTFEATRPYDNVRYSLREEWTALSDGHGIHQLDVTWAQRFEELRECLDVLLWIDWVNRSYPKLDELINIFMATKEAPFNWWLASDLLKLRDNEAVWTRKFTDLTMIDKASFIRKAWKLFSDEYLPNLEFCIKQLEKVKITLTQFEQLEKTLPSAFK